MIKNKGVAIGNGLTNPEIQYGAYADYALEMKLISQSVHESLKQDYVDCQSSIRICSNLYKHHHFNYIGFGSDLFFKDILILLFSDRDGGLACNSSYYICNQIPEQILSENEGINVRIRVFSCFLLFCFCLKLVLSFTCYNFSVSFEVLRLEENMCRRNVL